MDYIVQTLQIVAWPSIVLVLGLTFRGSIGTLIRRMNKAKYRDFEFSFDRSLAQAEADLPTAGEATQRTTRDPAISDTDDPSAVVLRAWADLETTAAAKIRAVLPQSASNLVARSDPVSYFVHFGATLSPRIARVAGTLHRLRNNLVHGQVETPSINDARRFAAAAAQVRSEVERVESVALFSITSLTYVLFEINTMIDTGRYDDITVAEISEHIRHRDVLPFLAERGADDVDFSLVLTSKPTFPAFVNYYHDELLDILEAYAGRIRRKWGVESRGLCLLVAWTTEMLQRGTGWQPDASRYSA